MKRVTFKCFFRVLTVFTLLLSLTLLPSCAFANMHAIAIDPPSHPGSTWSTPDGKITFTVQEEYIVRFEGKVEISTGEFVEASPLQTNIFGEISTECGPLPVFISFHSPASSVIFYSEDMPYKSGDTEDRTYVLMEYSLLQCELYRKSKKHFELKVEFSKIDEIPEGTVFDFYRTDAE